MLKKNRKPKDYEFSTTADEDYDDDNPCVITEADGTKRATRPGEVQRMLVGEEVAAARLADPTLRTDYEEHMENRRRASVPAHTVGLSVSETGNAANPTRPAHTAGSEGTAHQATTTPPQKSSVSSTTKSPKDPRPCTKSSPPATTSVNIKSGQVQPQHTPEPPQQPAHTAGAEGETSTEAAHTAAPAAGDAGEGVEVASTSTLQPADASKPPAGQKARRKASKVTGRLSPGLERHRERHAKKEKQLIPVIDPRVYKDSAAQLSLQKALITPWVNEYQHKDYEYLGNICALQVPWAYLPDGTYNDLPNWRKLHTLKDVTVGHVIAENKRLPHRYILTYTFGIDPVVQMFIRLLNP